MIAAMARALTIVLLVGLLPRHASAQAARPLDVWGGYSLAHDPRDEVTLPAGWVAGAAIGVTPWLSVVGDVSGQYKTVVLLVSEAQISVHTAMGGARASARIGRLIEFGQLLAGAVRTSGSAFGATNVNRSLGIQPGVGADYPLTRRFNARAELDIRLMRSQPDTANGGYEYRFAAGLVYRLVPR